MPTLEPLFVEPAPPAPLTPEQLIQRKAIKIANLKKRCGNITARALKQLDAAHREGLNAIWADPDLTPVEAFAALGNTAARLVQGSKATTDYLVAQFAVAGVPYTPPVLPENITLTLNEDGTVTVNIAQA